MLWCLVIGLHAMDAQAFAPAAPAPLRWGGHLSQRFVLATTSQKLTLLNLHDKISPSEIPRFVAKPDKTIALVSTGQCLEIEKDDIGLNHCTGRPTQRWNLLPSGDGQDFRIQSENSNNCMDATDENSGASGVTIHLHRCDRASMQLWAFEEALPPPRGSSSPRHEPLLSRAPGHPLGLSPPMQLLLISFTSMAALGFLSLGAWSWQQKRKSHMMPLCQGDASMSVDVDSIGGVSLSAPVAVQPHGIHMSSSDSQGGRNSLISMSAIEEGEATVSASIGLQKFACSPFRRSLGPDPCVGTLRMQSSKADTPRLPSRRDFVNSIGSVALLNGMARLPAHASEMPLSARQRQIKEAQGKGAVDKSQEVKFDQSQEVKGRVNGLPAVMATKEQSEQLEEEAKKIKIPEVPADSDLGLVLSGKDFSSLGQMTADEMIEAEVAWRQGAPFAP